MNILLIYLGSSGHTYAIKTVLESFCIFLFFRNKVDILSRKSLLNSSRKIKKKTSNHLSGRTLVYQYKAAS
jgi:hypothetical protein